MEENQSGLRALRSEHPVFYWGVVAVLVMLLGATGVVGLRSWLYDREEASLEALLSEAERETRDGLLDTRTRKEQLALALIRRELRLKSLEEDGVHLAINTEDSVLSLRHGAATLREMPVRIGPDSVIRAPDGRTWRFVRALGERHLREKQRSPEYTVPEWVYVARGEPVPPEGERRVEGALGDLVLVLDDGTEIYTTPETGPFAGAVKPAAFEVPEEDLRAIFDALELDTPVYIY